jgi:hypothetical protein
MDKLIMDLVAKMTIANSEAILQLALILERSTFTISSDSTYILNLPPHLLNIILMPDDQREIIDDISQRILSGASNRSQLFWVIGKAPRVALVPLITLLEAHSQTFDEETAWQALIALENCLELDDDGNLRTDSLRLINKANLRPIIQQMASINISNSGDPRSGRLVEIVHRILRRTET